MIYIGLLFLSFVLTYLIRNYALKKSLVDIPNERSSHTVPTPHGGGIAIVITWFTGLVYLYMYGFIEKDIFYALLVGVIISVVSFFDDLYELSPKFRIFAQFFVAGLGLYMLGGLSKIDLYFFVIENVFLTNLFALFLIVWFINLYNFLDGIDGYAGSEAIFLGIVGYLFFKDSVFLVLVASVLGFLFWNWQRAKIFMGDTGSTLLGYSVAIFAIYYQNHGYSIIIWFILFGLFWFDATLTLFRRYKNGEKLSQAHKKHAYQRLNQSGWSHSKVTVYAIFVNFILFLIAFVAFNFTSLSLLMLIVAIIFLYFITLYIDKRKKFI